jgi:hypothetical protein
VHPGEHLSCLGCHENKWKAPPLRREPPLAMRRAPSKLIPEAEGSLPMSFARLALPVLQAKCTDCHVKERVHPDFAGDYRSNSKVSARAYDSLEPYMFYFHGSGSSQGLSPIHGGYRTIPGRCGARQSKLLQYLTPAHYNVQLTSEELHRLTLWLDLNSNELGAYHDPVRQQRGEIVWPDGVDPSNPTGIEMDRPLP